MTPRRWAPYRPLMVFLAVLGALVTLIGLFISAANSEPMQPMPRLHVVVTTVYTTQTVYPT